MPPSYPAAPASAVASLERSSCTILAMLPSDLDPDTLLLLIVGAHPQAERDDRPLANKLRERIDRWVAALPAEQASGAIEPFVLTDLWYLNDDNLRRQPVISIGDPEFNAASAYLANRLPEALVIDGSLRIQMDQEFAELRACLWGTSVAATGSAVELFIERHLDAFLRAAHSLPPT